MRIISWNVNGLRSVYNKGVFIKWLEKGNADIVCLQETKAQKQQLSPDLLKPGGYYSYFSSAEKKGYSGVAVYTKSKPFSVRRKLGIERFDNEGRILELKYPEFTLINIYIPHGGRGKENLEYKLEVYKKLIRKLEKLKDKKVILAGDMNIAHEEKDLARPKQNKNNIMFTVEEREQIDKLINLGFVDSFRKFHKGSKNYTWWPYMANARKRNLGWRIDYLFTSKILARKLNNASISKGIIGSDHCPIGMEI